MSIDQQTGIDPQKYLYPTGAEKPSNIDQQTGIDPQKYLYPAEETAPSAIDPDAAKYLVGRDVQLSATSKLEQHGAKVVHVGSDGTQVLLLPDGTMNVLNEKMGYSSTNPEEAKAIMAGMPLETIMRRGESEAIVQKYPGAAASAQLLESIPFVGSYVGEAMGEPEQVDRLASAYREVNPSAATALGLTGAIGGGAAQAYGVGQIPKAKQFYDWVSSLPRYKKYASYFGLGGLGAGTEDVIYKAGTEEGADVSSAAKSALLGGTVGTAMPLLGFAASKVWSTLKSLRSDATIQAIRNEFGVSKEAAEVLRQNFRETDDIEQALANIKRAGDQGMIADADEAASSLLDTIVAVDVAAGKQAGQAVEQRAVGAAQDLGRVMDEKVAPTRSTVGEQGEELVADRFDYMKSISDSTKDARQGAYKAFYETPINYASPTGRVIEDVLTRVPPKLMAKAIELANVEMKRKPELAATRQIMADIADDGTVTFREMPNAIQLDYIKRSIGDFAFNKSLAQTTEEATQQRHARDAYRELNKAIGEASPSYREATRLGGDKIMRGQAFDLGMTVIDKRVTPAEFARDFKGLDEGQRVYARAGMRTSIEELVSNAKSNITTSQEEVVALRKTLAELSSGAAKTKMTTLLGRDNATALQKELDRMRAALELRANIAANSKTARRQATADIFEDVLEPSAVDRVMEGKPMEMTQKIIQTAAGTTKELKQEAKTKVLREVAKVMTERKGTEAAKGMRVIYDAIRTGRATADDYEKAYSLLVNSVTLPAGIFGVSELTLGEDE